MRTRAISACGSPECCCTYSSYSVRAGSPLAEVDVALGHGQLHLRRDRRGGVLGENAGIGLHRVFPGLVRLVRLADLKQSLRSARVGRKAIDERAVDVHCFQISLRGGELLADCVNLCADRFVVAGEAEILLVRLDGTKRVAKVGGVQLRLPQHGLMGAGMRGKEHWDLAEDVDRLLLLIERHQPLGKVPEAFREVDDCGMIG